jgi:hypothetical protein
MDYSGNEYFHFLRHLTAVVIKSSIFLDITPCNQLKINRHFGGTCRTDEEASKKQACSGLCLLFALRCFLLGLLLRPKDGGDIFLRNVGLLSRNYMALHPRIQSSTG